MQEQIQNILETLKQGKSVAFAMLVETRGSTPQKAGACMTVYPDGSQSGTLGGGCVEADVKRDALKLLNEGGRELITFQLDHETGWEEGLICGGRMKMLVDPIHPKDDRTYFEKIEQLLSSNKGFTQAVVLDTHEETKSQSGSFYLINENGELEASCGESEPPEKLLENIKPLESRPRPYVKNGISYLPHLKKDRVIIIGAGHVGQKVGELAAEASFEVWVVDDRKEYCNPERLPFAANLIVDDFENGLEQLEIHHNTYCIIVTRGHKHDGETLFHIAETDACYIGMIGSKRKIKLIFEELLREGISREALEKVKAPLGFNIGSQTVPEIAISIVAELIACRNLGEVPEQIRKPSVMKEIPE